MPNKCRQATHVPVRMICRSASTSGRLTDAMGQSARSCLTSGVDTVEAWTAARARNSAPPRSVSLLPPPLPLLLLVASCALRSNATPPRFAATVGGGFGGAPATGDPAPCRSAYSANVTSVAVAATHATVCHRRHVRKHATLRAIVAVSRPCARALPIRALFSLLCFSAALLLCVQMMTTPDSDAGNDFGLSARARAAVASRSNANTRRAQILHCQSHLRHPRVPPRRAAAAARALIHRLAVAALLLCCSPRLAGRARVTSHS